MVTAALFDIRQKDVLTGDPANFFFNVQTDAVRVRGFELELRATSPASWRSWRVTAISIRA